MKKLIVLILSTLTFVSCDNYTDVGENPNNLHTADAKPDQYLSAAQALSYSNQATTMEQLGLLFANTCGGNVQTYATPFINEFSFNVSTTFYSTIFTNIYLNTNSYQKIINYNDVNAEYKNFKAIAKIGKVYNLQYVVDLYGDAPYVEAFQGLNNVTPKYDDDYFIYQQLFAELDDARALIDNVIGNVYPNTISAASTDIIFQGDLSKWRRFANTIELKMLIRMSNCSGAAAAYRDARLANMVANNNNVFITSDITINPGYSTARIDTMNPQFGYFISDNVGNPQYFGLFAPSGYIVKCLNAYANVNYASTSDQEIIPGKGVFYPNVEDPRRKAIFAISSTGAQRGVTQGSTIVDVIKPGTTNTGQPSRFGSAFFNLYNNTSFSGSLVTSPSGLFSSTLRNALGSSNGYIMTMAESSFLQAEAAHLGTQIPGYAVLGLNAQSAFTSGVSYCMSQYLITSSAMNNYITQISNTSNANLKNFWYNPSNTFAQNYHAIMYQKWLSLAPSNAIESYLDLTRTGYPINPLPLNNSYPQRPNRLIYPSSEYIANSSNVPNVTIGDLFSVNAKSPFWLQ